MVHTDVSRRLNMIFKRSGQANARASMEAKFFVGQAGVFQVQFYLVMSWLDSNVFFKVTHYNMFKCTINRTW